MKVYIKLHPLYVVAFIALTILKLTHVIELSWLWITAPVWVPCSISLIIILGVIIYSTIKEWR